MPTITRALRVRESADASYARWRDPDEVTRFSAGIEAFSRVDENTVRARLRGPIGPPMEVRLALTKHEPGRLMVWKATNTPFPAIFAVRFEPLADADDENRVTLQLTLDPPGGPFVARAVEGFTVRLVEETLRRFKAHAEAESN